MDSFWFFLFILMLFAYIGSREELRKKVTTPLQRFQEKLNKTANSRSSKEKKARQASSALIDYVMEEIDSTDKTPGEVAEGFQRAQSVLNYMEYLDAAPIHVGESAGMGTANSLLTEADKTKILEDAFVARLVELTDTRGKTQLEIEEGLALARYLLEQRKQRGWKLDVKRIPRCLR